MLDDDEPMSEENDDSESPAEDAKKATDKAIPFLEKTYALLDVCDKRIAAWATDGLSFFILDSTLFATRIIPRYFKHNKFSSFVRQLNFYGFKNVNSKTTKAGVSGGHMKVVFQFKHPRFIRGSPHLFRSIKRKRPCQMECKGDTSTKASSELLAQANEIQQLKQSMDNIQHVVEDLRYQISQSNQLIAQLMQERGHYFPTSTNCASQIDPRFISLEQTRIFSRKSNNVLHKLRYVDKSIWVVSRVDNHSSRCVSPTLE
ncbi:hypothetical protein AeMF1_005079 [Aphanomyces euteiches]|nr:hypothetical protein AeMF1_014317 [Aphanomyces euteiches]KAH9112504.1 hypothetical protein AeMF1_013176 [Aphanomyces euteiches]KAH9118697.1 hypothetical protein AeMF1_008274 [Aphanomyces euteiches]KAH9121171.1 hypothetical protein AeMF1_007008 [Aphanomyces euteiches]KAH9124090.1 hypothetical protein AeMF1_005079 [Aphanomyces euteiches]